MPFQGRTLMVRSFRRKVQRSKQTSESLRATIPGSVAAALGLQEGDYSSWAVEPGWTKVVLTRHRGDSVPRRASGDEPPFQYSRPCFRNPSPDPFSAQSRRRGSESFRGRRRDLWGERRGQFDQVPVGVVDLEVP